MKAIWKGQVLAESEKTVVVEGNHYFPADSLNKDHFVGSDLQTTCPWKGQASYFHVKVGNEVNQDAAWVYSSPKEAAKKIEGYVAFWRGVEVVN
ncbi:MAG: DUF427 domain-containing protein [Bacteroidota bacterium]